MANVSDIKKQPPIEEAMDQAEMLLKEVETRFLEDSNEMEHVVQLENKFTNMDFSDLFAYMIANKVFFKFDASDRAKSIFEKFEIIEAECIKKFNITIE